MQCVYLPDKGCDNRRTSNSLYCREHIDELKKKKLGDIAAIESRTALLESRLERVVMLRNRELYDDMLLQYEPGSYLEHEDGSRFLLVWKVFISMEELKPALEC